jgi:hypothetical protein
MTIKRRTLPQDFQRPHIPTVTKLGDPNRFARPRAPKIPYDPDLAEYILEQIKAGRSLNKICQEPLMPTPAAILAWTTALPDFAALYLEAMEVRAEVWVEGMMDEVRDGSNDFYQDEKGNLVFQRDHVMRSKLIADTKKWYVGKIKAKKYGDAATMKLADADGNNLPPAPPPLIIQFTPSKK